MPDPPGPDTPTGQGGDGEGKSSIEGPTRIIRDSETLRGELQKAMAQPACLVIVRGPGQGKRLLLTADKTVLGRGITADIRIEDETVSAKHCSFLKRDDDVHVVDLGSSNGTFLNDKRLKEQQSYQLRKDDLLRAGNMMLKFLPPGALETVLQEVLEDKAYTDPVTGIRNKRFLLEALDADIQRARRLDSHLTVVFFDIDFFKRVNDTWGHEAGDGVLRELATVAGSLLRQNDVIARVGGEEFVILAVETAAQTGQQLAERIRAAIERHEFMFGDTRIPVTCSFGVAEFSPALDSAQALLAAADKALYASKRSGRNRVT
jgi:diguanylate cyclase (GGDEF)-like protein